MVSEIKLEFSEFITHIPQSKKKFIKIGFNRIYASSHYSTRDALVSAMHGYIKKHIPINMTIQTPVRTELIIYAPINYGNVKLLKDRKTGNRYLNWKPAAKGYKPNWDLDNLAVLWIKCINDVLIKKGLLPEDTVEFIQKTSFEYEEVKTLKERKLVYKLKTIK